MKLKEVISRSWRNFEAFAQSLDYDPNVDLGTRLGRLEFDGEFQGAHLQSLSDDVQSLQERVRRLEGRT